MISKTLSRTFAADGLLTSLTYPGSTGSSQFVYNANNPLESVQVPGLPPNHDTLRYTYRWQAISEVTMPGSLKRIVSTDALLRPERIRVGTTANPGSVLDHRYRYDEVSNIDEKRTLDGPYQYRYDVLDRLMEAKPPESLQQSAVNPDGLPLEKYAYDGVHNRIVSEHQPGMWVLNANNELTQWGMGAEKRVLSYDANCSTIKEDIGDPVTQSTDYGYDAQDRLVEIKRDAVVIAEYAYDPMGRRIWRKTLGTNTSTTWFLYSDEGLIGEYDQTGARIREYGWNPQGLWGTDVVWQKDANGTFLAHNDHLYTTDVLTRADTGAEAWRAVRESFGKTSVMPGNETEYLMRFPGQWEDGVGGFTYNFFRSYGSTIGRYGESDPIGLKGGINIFTYVAANAILGFDATGLDYWVEDADPSESGLGAHQSICVGKHGTSNRFCISFGRIPGQDCWFKCRGHTYRDRSPPGDIVDPMHRITSASVDRRIKRYLQSRLGEKRQWDALGGENCRVFSQEVFNYLLTHFGGDRPPRNLYPEMPPVLR